jgi:hypothetical protein
VRADETLGSSGPPLWGPMMRSPVAARLRESRRNAESPCVGWMSSFAKEGKRDVRLKTSPLVGCVRAGRTERPFASTANRIRARCYVRAGLMAGWAIQDLNGYPKPQQNLTTQDTGAAKCAASGADSFADAVQSIMRLPLSDSEKAEAVRRLLACTEVKA